MNRHTKAFPAYYRRGWMDYVIGLMLYSFVTSRMLINENQDNFPVLTAGLLACFLLLLVFEAALLQRYPRWRDPYFVLIAICVQALGLTQPYQDIWTFLYCVIAGEALFYYSVPVALGWCSFYVASAFLTMGFTLDWLRSAAFTLNYLALGVLFISYTVMYQQAEAASRESKRLLSDLQHANQQLQAYAGQIEEITTLQEHNRLAHKLHDSVGQDIFSISLTAESASILLDKDPSRLPELLEHLQEQTGSALAQMRALIQQWRPN